MNKHPQTKEELSASLEARNLCMQFGNNTALDNLSFKVSQGEIFCLLGQNGNYILEITLPRSLAYLCRAITHNFL